MTLDEQVLAEAKEIRGSASSTSRARQRTRGSTTTTRSRSSTPPAARCARSPRRSSSPTSASTRSSRARRGVPGPPPWVPRGGWRRHRGRHGSNRKYFVARFDDGAREVMVEAQKEADSLEAQLHRHRAPDARARQARGRGRLLRRGARAGRRADRRGRRALDRRDAASVHAAGEARPRGGPERRHRRRTGAVRPGRDPAGDRVRLAGRRRRGASRPRRHTRAAARAARADSRRGRVAAAVQLHEQRRCSVRPPRRAASPTLASPPTAPSVAAAAAAASSAASAASSAIRSGRSIVRCARLVRARGQELAVGGGVLRGERREPARRRARARWARSCAADDARGQASPAGGELDRRDDRRPRGERLRRAQRFGHSRRCRR